MIGLDSSFYFSHDLKYYLLDYGITSLHYACNPVEGTKSFWFSEDNMELGREWKSEWNNYIYYLSHGVIILKETSKSLLWTHNKKYGKVTASLVYDLIAKTNLVPIQNKFFFSYMAFQDPIEDQMLFLVST